MNFKKYTKAELISKIKSSQEKLDNKFNNLNKIGKEYSIIIQIKSYFSQIWELVLTFKNLLIKLTLISFFLQFLKKYRIFRRLWAILNTIVMSIFGISLFDNFGIEFISNLFKEIRNLSWNTVDYLTNTHFYKYLINLFNKNEEVNIPSITGNNSIDKNKDTHIKERTPIWVENALKEKPGKISDWLKPEIHDSEVKEIVESETSYNKYYIICGMLILSCLGWFYWENIKSGGGSLLEWIRSFRGGPDPGDDNIIDTSTARRELEQIVHDKTKNTNEKLIEIMEKSKSKSVRIVSPSLENLNEEVEQSWNISSPTKSTSSTSSTETIKQSYPIGATSSKIKLDSPLPLLKTSDGDSLTGSLLDLNDKWKNVIKADLKESINFVETHLPKSELDDTTYINKLLEDINKKNIDFLKELNIKSNENKILPSKLVYLTEIGKNVDKWIEKMHLEINKFN
jgi:hypothetical protein